MKADFGQSILRKYLRWITNRPRFIIVLIILITGLLSTQLVNLRIYIDTDKALPPEHPLIVLGNRITEIFGGKYVMVISLEVKEGTVFNPSTLSKVQRITDKIRNIPGVIQSNVLSLSAINAKDIEGTPEGMKINRLMPTIPTNDEEMRRLKARVYRNDMMVGLLVSEDSTTTSILSDYLDIDRAGGFNGLMDRVNKILELERDDNTVFRMAGMPVFINWLLIYSARMRYVFPLAFFVIGLILYYAFRTGQGVAIPLMTALLSVLWSLGLMGLLGISLDTFNLMTPILILAVAAGHSVQILKRYYEEYNQLKNNQEAVIEATSRVGIAMLTAGFVASAGFASLITFETPTIRAFGLLTAFGILAALIIEMTFIPAIRTLLKPPSEHHTAKEKRRMIFDPFLEKTSEWITGKQNLKIIIIFGVVLVLALVGSFLLRIDTTMTSNFPETSEIIQDIRATNKKMAGAFVMQILVEGDKEDAMKEPQALRDMEALQNYIATKPNVGKVVSLVDFVKKMNKAMHADNPAFEVLPDSKDLIAQYLLLYSMSGDPGDFDRVVDYNYQRAVISLYEKDEDLEKVREIKSDIEQFVHHNLSQSHLHFSVAGGLLNGVALEDVVVEGKIKNIIQVSAVIFLIASLVFVSFVGGIYVLLPIVMAIIVNLGVMGFLDIPLSIGTATISAMALGIGADYAIYFLFRLREEIAKSGDWNSALLIAETTSGKAVLFVASAIAAGYFCLFFSGFLIHVFLGTLVPLTMIVSSLAALTLMPSLVVRVKPKFLLKKIRRIK